jgi:hypothetical protein
MAWGIMMTAVMLLGMLGIAMFQATTDEKPSRGSMAKSPAGSAKNEWKNAA